MFYEQKFLFSLLLTLIIEIPIIVLFVKKFYKHKQIPTHKVIFIGAVASTLTLPYLWFVLPAYILDRLLYIAFSEILIIFVEAVIYNQFFKLKLSKALIMSLVANVISMAFGLLIN